ncbi:LysR family transcriptional regulator [Streptomyces canus]|uniref:LysR family transcriptional regulator n=1 Tax=Streptomyces canus TaxID=58343 RepID=UPI0036C9D500
MEIRQLRCVVAVAEELHFGRAAQRLQMSQAPLSAQIKRIEREVGFPLFERTTRSVQLTTVGAEFYHRAVVILEQVDQATADLEQVAAGRAGRLRVGFPSSASYSILPHAVRSSREQAPDLDIDLVPLTSTEQVERIHEGTIDIGIVRGEAAALDLQTRRLYEEQIVACLPKDHLLAANEFVSAEDLAREPLIFFPTRDMPGFVAEIRPIFEGMPFPSVRTRVVHQETALGFVAAGVGFTLLPESVTSFMPASVRVARIDSRPTTVMYVAEPRTLSPAARLFRRALFEAAAAVSEPSEPLSA